MKSAYKELLLELEKEFAVGVNLLGHKLKALHTLQLELEDDKVIRSGISEICDGLKTACVLRNCQNYQKSYTTMEKTKALIQNLSEYCRAKADTNEPDWMILARIHGWTPPCNQTEASV